jgi:hypothetical protein
MARERISRRRRAPKQDFGAATKLNDQTLNCFARAHKSEESDEVDNLNIAPQHRL